MQKMLLWALLVLLGASIGQAQPATSSALNRLRDACQRDGACDEHVANAEKWITSGNWEQLIREYQDAYKLVPYPRFLFNIARAHHKLLHYREAIEFYQRHLEATPVDDPDFRNKSQNYKSQAERFLEARDQISQTTGVPGSAHGAAKSSQNSSSTSSERDISRPVYRRWWFWTALGGVLAGGVTAGIVIGTWPRTPANLDRFQLEFQK